MKLYVIAIRNYIKKKTPSINSNSILPPHLNVPCCTSLTTTLRLQASRSLSVAT